MKSQRPTNHQHLAPVTYRYVLPLLCHWKLGVHSEIPFPMHLGVAE